MNKIVFIIFIILITFNITKGSYENLNGNNYLIQTIDTLSFSGNFNFSNDFGKVGGGICFSGVGGGFNVLKFSSELGNTEMFIIKREYDYIFENYDYLETCKYLEEISNSYYLPNQLKNEPFYDFLDQQFSWYSNCYNIYLKNCDILKNHTSDSISYEIQIYKITSPLNISHQTIASFHIFFIIFFILIFCISVFHVFILKQKKIKCGIIIMFLFVIILSIIGHSLYISNWSFQLKNMVELSGRILIGNLCTFTSNSLFSLLIINIGQGWGLINNYGTWLGIVINGGIFFSTEILGLSAYFVEANGKIHGGEYENPFKSGVGYVLIVVQSLTIFYFIFSNKVFKNMNSSDQYEQSFLFKFKTIFSIWLASIPIIEIISIFISNNSFRFGLFGIIGDSFNLIFYLLIIYIYHPCKSNTLVKRLNSYYDDELSIQRNQPKTVDEINLENLYNK
ncbi:hypothetical protein ACTFIV_002858 [Dictyostelium citrinum]